ncbi:MAG: hypothetical protein HN576_01250 [Bacteriovoracaceae bacterium]|jgi:hypothetical protein|nr:hypothetical protein [Bacteriovoracaceae bacterium]
MKMILAGILFYSSVSFATTSYDLSCINNDIDTDLGTAKLALHTTLTVNGANNYAIENGNLKFFIEDAWTDQDVNIEKVNNYKKYRPRTYKNHAKFPNVGKKFFGKVDFIAPHNALIEGKEKFDGVFILSWVEDHWGGTVITECSLNLINQE